MAYSDGEKAAALVRLAINKYDFKKTASETGITAKTLREWNKNVPKKSVSDLLDVAIQRMLVSIPTKMSGQDWAVALGILMDKWLLIQGEPTSRTETIQRQVSALTDDEYDNLLEEAGDILRKARGGSGDTYTGDDRPD
jgi:hypothetical protein